MARSRLEAYRLGPASLALGGAVQTVGSIDLATLTSGMADKQILYVDVVCALFCEDDQTDMYALLITATIAVRYRSSGPTYNLGTVSTSTINSAASGGVAADMFSAITIDQSSGLLRVRLTTNLFNVQAYAVMSTFAP